MLEDIANSYLNVLAEGGIQLALEGKNDNENSIHFIYHSFFLLSVFFFLFFSHLPVSFFFSSFLLFFFLLFYCPIVQILRILRDNLNA